MNNTCIEEITAIVGQSHVLLQQEEMEPFLAERRGLYKGSCIAIVQPGNTEETAAVVKSCNNHNVPFTPQSGNTGLCGGAVPSGGILINVSRMNATRDIDPLNATLTAEAGSILADLQKAAEEQDLYLTLSSPSEAECQIGGCVSTNMGGINVLRYGNTRDLILGLEVVLPQGDIWHGLRGLRKDNSGYNLKHLFIGAEGTLGIVTAVTLKLFPQPKIMQTALITSPSLTQLMDDFAMVRRGFAENLCGFEIISRTAMEVVCECGIDTSDPFPDSAPWYGLMELNSSDSNLNLYEPLQKLLQNCSGTCIIASDREEARRLWSLREQISEAQKVKGASIKHDVSLPLNRLADFIAKATALVTEMIPGVLVCCFGHAGDGNVHFNLTQPSSMDGEAFLALWSEVNRIVHDVVHSMDGSIAAEHGVGQLKREELRRYKTPLELELMRSVKKAIDPGNICNPGKIIEIP